MTNWTLARAPQSMNPSVIREILKVTERPGIISFAGGLPSPQTFPVAGLRAGLRQGAEDDGPARCSTPPAKATRRCAKQVAAMLPWQVDPAQVLVTTGSQQGLDLVAKVLIDSRQPRAGGDADVPGRAAGLRAHGAGGGRRASDDEAWTWTTSRPRRRVRASSTCCPTSRTRPAAP
jgi:hypothetical protein